MACCAYLSSDRDTRAEPTTVRRAARCAVMAVAVAGGRIAKHGKGLLLLRILNNNTV